MGRLRQAGLGSTGAPGYGLDAGRCPGKVSGYGCVSSMVAGLRLQVAGVVLGYPRMGATPDVKRPACEWCSKPATPGLRDADGDPICRDCLALPGPVTPAEPPGAWESMITGFAAIPPKLTGA